jgi:cell division protease FtsH
MNNNNNKRPLINLIPYLFVSLFLIMMAFSNPVKTNNTNLNYREFNELVETQKIASAKVSVDYNTMTITGVYKEGDGSSHPFTAIIPNTEKAADELIDELKKVDNVTFVDANASNYLLELISSIVPLVLFAIAGLFIMNRMGAMNSNKQAFDFSKSRARLEDNVKIRFSDVAGCDEEKEEMQEIIEYLKNPKKFSRMGARIPKGIIMVGPPGTGKTLLAKAVAGEANVPFYSISGSDFVEMFVGVGASRVRDLFESAKAKAPCIIFVDEIDAVGRQRGAGLGGGNDEREQTLNQLLVEMDGFGSDLGIIVIAATNRPDVLDPALLRPGRFDRQVYVPLPDIKGRELILKVHAEKIKTAPDINFADIAKGTPGLSGADLANLLNEAALIAASRSENEVTMADIEDAKDKIFMGKARKTMVQTPEEKKDTAYHEAGHVVVGLYSKYADPVHKVSIVPRGRALGVTQQLPEKDKYSYHRAELIDRIKVLMGGRAAEEVFIGRITTGAGNDIERATQIARNMVMQWGMGEDLGPISYGEKEEQVFLGRELGKRTQVSEATSQKIDEEVQKIIETAYADAKNMLETHRDGVERLVAALIEKETLERDEIMEAVEPKSQTEAAEEEKTE